MSKTTLNALATRLKQLQNCPACGAFGVGIEDFNPAVFEFIIEARFSCGAAVKLSNSATLDVGTACPEALREALDRVEEDVRDELEDDPT